MLRFSRGIFGLGLRTTALSAPSIPVTYSFEVAQKLVPISSLNVAAVRQFSRSVPKYKVEPIVQSSTLMPAPANAPKLKPSDEGYIPKIQLRMLAFDYAVVDSYVTFVRRAAQAFGINCSGRIPLPTHIRRLTILKSPHVYKKHRIQYEQRIHKRLIQLKNVTEKTANVFLEYIELNIPPGVGMKIKKVSLEPRGLP